VAGELLDASQRAMTADNKVWNEKTKKNEVDK